MLVDSALTLEPTENPVDLTGSDHLVVAIPSQWGKLKVTVVHEGLVASGRPATEREIQGIFRDSNDIGLTNQTDREIAIGWVGSICDRVAILAVDSDRVVLAPAPRPGCDAVGYGWGVVLTMRRPFDVRPLRAIKLPTTILP
jgi:hypothetical protein